MAALGTTYAGQRARHRALHGRRAEHGEGPVSYSFRCSGHPNIRAKHYKSLELTRDAEIGRAATCIIGVRCNFDCGRLKALSGKIRVTLAVDDLRDEFVAIANPGFQDEREIVFRRGAYASDRTLGVRASKSALHISWEMVERMRDPAAQVVVTIEELAKPDLA